MKKFLDPDLILTIKDRLLSPKYYCFNERKLTIFLKKIGFKNIYRIKKKVYFSNIRKLLSPLYHHYDHEISRALYGDGDISLICSKWFRLIFFLKLLNILQLLDFIKR